MVGQFALVGSRASLCHRLWIELLDAWGELSWAGNVIAAMLGAEVELDEEKHGCWR
jgi:hypothetical protein